MKNTQKLRIGYLLDDTLDKPDGVQQYVLAVSDYFRKQDHDVHYLVAETTRTDLPNIHSLSKFMSLKFNGNTVRTPLPASTKEIKALLAKLDLDVLHVQLGFSPFFGAKVIKNVSSTCRVIGTWHTFPAGTMHYFGNWFLGRLIHKPLARFDHIFAVSKATAEFAKNVYGTESEVLGNAVPLDNFRELKVSQNSTKTKKRIVFLGRFVERKGPLYLIRAISKLPGLGIDLSGIEVVMGGKGPDLEKAMRLSESLGLQNVIVFPGFIHENDKARLLSSADITVFPSTGGEAFGISVVEAMASGSSIVLGGDNPGYASILGNKPELLFDPKNIDVFAEKLAHYIGMDEKSADKLKLWLKAESEQYNTPVICEKLTELYIQK